MGKINSTLRVSFATLFLLLFFACKKESAMALPDCIKTKIENFKNQVVCSTGAGVSHFLFQSKNVYLFGDGNCLVDGGAEVYDDNCTLLGTLGTIAGITKINGISFSENATLITIIWQN